MNSELIACHDCDLVQRVLALPARGAALCGRCGAVLRRHKTDTVDRSVALALAGTILFAATHAFPFLSFHMQGQATETHLVTGIRDLYDGGQASLAALVLVTSVLAPGMQLAGLLYVLLPLKLGTHAPGATTVFRLLRRIQAWSMMEVFMLGVLVSLVKLADMAQIVPGIALWSFALLILVMAAASAALDPPVVWKLLEREA